MVDAATRNGRSMFGINIQYRYLRLATLAMYELKKAHTAEYLGDVVLNVLNRYGIKLEQILTFTTDNGSNMLAMVKNLEKRIFGAGNAHEIDSVEGDCDIQEEENQDADTEALNILLNTDSEFDQLFDSIYSHLKKNINNRTMFLSTIRCAAHTLQLIVWDALEDMDENDREIINLCREAAKFLRLQGSRNKIREASLTCTLPPLDCKTRWSSTYLMVNKTYIFAIFGRYAYINFSHHFLSCFQKVF